MAETILNDTTPNRKRKRDFEKRNEIKCSFSNTAFSSTPKIAGRRRLISADKENVIPSNSCMEVKSIAELVAKQKEESLASKTTSLNPYEVQRKPPKKKKRESIEEACFENPALNLNLPEKQFNPYEVVRDLNKNQEDQRKCFVNEALNIKSQDAVVVRNPFEIERQQLKPDFVRTPIAGYENLGLESMQPTSLKIGLPFTPTVGCRIDFNNLPLSQLTPSKLMLNEKLVFSPVPINSVLPKRSLDAISEESSSVSIGKELDRYQLELENSINEAKMRKKDASIETSVMENETIYQLQLKVEKRASLTTKLSDIDENDEYETENINKVEITELETKCIKSKTEFEMEKAKTTKSESLHLKNNVEVPQNVCTSNCNAGFSFDSDKDVDFKTPAPFIRVYRRDDVPKSISKESLNSNNSTKSSTENIPNSTKQSSVKNLLRKSLRKLIPNNHHNKQVNNDLKPTIETYNAQETEEKQCTITSHLISSIRQSLRRKPKEEIKSSVPNLPQDEISIIDTSERKMKLKSNNTQNEYARIEELTNEKKNLFLRKSTREMRNQMMNKLFLQHKHEEYCFKK